MGLRERKKEETRKTLLEQAGALFAAKGYQNVTTAEIAREAGIAEGTLFNYFRNKGELFVAAVMPEPAIETFRGAELEDPSPRRLAAAIVDMLDGELSRFERVEKRMLQDYFAIVYGGALAESAEARAGLFAADERMLVRVRSFLEAQKQAFSARMAGFDADLAASCIFGCVVTLMNQYVLIEGYSYAQFKKTMFDQISFILTGHVASP
ncbi:MULTISPECIES: TetR/AcrR family transcriptional regulator [Cohnella]|uniref:TetR/AcrR family transcriptional regulator n=1 Tax=Cohnella TaxID=329857 RepID=UPI0009BB8D69|nr:MULTISPECIES: TetR/AcrR family transcriptional regulator [Cohnella]MBN2983949.1 TetR/AcrR family transcriptional regulator [Cohnella algarum]